MPIYEYKCKKCNKTVTINKALSDLDKEETCSACNSVLNRVYSSIGVTFNGSGFYSTDK